ncbi:MAG: hypothetical protein ACI4DP_03350 [Candidatus Ornithomonoglobus sp.]
MIDIKLKPCPFCGNTKPRILHWDRKIYVVCDGMHGCGASSGQISYSLDNSIAKVTKEDLDNWYRQVTEWWNRRDE